MRMRFPSLLAPALILVGLSIPPAAFGQTAEEIFDAAMERHADRMEDVQSYTVVQEMMGFETTTHFTRRDGSDPPVFEAQTQVGGQNLQAFQQDDQPRDLSLSEMYSRFASRAELQGSEEVDGHSTYVIEVEDPQGLAFAERMPADQREGFTPERVVLYLDQEEFVPRKMEIEGRMAEDQGAGQVTMVMHMQDYRNVQGVLHPFRTTMVMEGVDAAMSAEDRAEAEQSLQQMRQQMEQMPAAQRQMMESMIRPQMERLEEMLGGGGFEMVTEVREVRVNTPPPGGP